MIRREKIICMSANGGEGVTLGKDCKSVSTACRSTSEPDIDIFSSRIGIFYSPFLHRNLVHLWRNTHKCRILQDIYFLYLIRRFVSGLIEYTCINTRKLKGFERNYIIAKEQKSDEHGASFQSSPKINRMHDHHETYFHLIKIFRFFDH